MTPSSRHWGLQMRSVRRRRTDRADNRGIGARERRQSRLLLRWMSVATLVGGLVGGLVLAPGQAGAVPSGWTITPSPSPDSNNPLLGVSCASPTYCVAVGLHSGSRGHEQTLVETWDGTS